MTTPMVIPAGGGVLIPAELAPTLARLLGDWPRRYPTLGLPLEHFSGVQAIVAALYESGHFPSVRGNAETQRKSDVKPSRPWLTSTQLAAATGYTPRRLRQMAAAGDLIADKSTGRWMFSPSAVNRLSSRRKEP